MTLASGKELNEDKSPLKNIHILIKIIGVLTRKIFQILTSETLQRKRLWKKKTYNVAKS